MRGRLAPIQPIASSSAKAFHADYAGAPAGRVEDHVRQFPAELLGELDPHRLFAFDAVRLSQRGTVEPADRPFAVADQLAAIIDEPVDQKHRGALHRDFADIDRRGILGAQDRALDAGARAIGSHCRPGIAV